jgi:branched-subunit amino acid ABC-type transport system permease component
MAGLRYVLDGLASGFVIALMALGVVVIYRSTRVLTFAQGAIASLNAYVFFQLYAPSRWGLPVGVAFALAMAVAAALGLASWAVFVHPLRGADPLTRTVATLGLVLVLQVLMRTVWGGNEQFLPPLVRGSVTLGSQTVGAQTVLIVVVTLATSAALAVWLSRSLTGLSLAATADDPISARLLGVSPARVSAVTWVLASALGALAGILVSPLLVLNPLQMTLIMVSSYGAALIGGFSSLPLAVAGGLVIGIVQSVATGLSTVSGVSETLGFVSVFAVLLVTRGRRGDLTELLQRGSL